MEKQRIERNFRHSHVQKCSLSSAGGRNAPTPIFADAVLKVLVELAYPPQIALWRDKSFFGASSIFCPPPLPLSRFLTCRMAVGGVAPIPKHK